MLWRTSRAVVIDLTIPARRVSRVAAQGVDCDAAGGGPGLRESRDA